jgi:hypothetical protein
MSKDVELLDNIHFIVIRLISVPSMTKFASTFRHCGAVRVARIVAEGIVTAVRVVSVVGRGGSGSPKILGSVKSPSWAFGLWFLRIMGGVGRLIVPADPRLSSKSAVIKPADQPEAFRSANQLRTRNK